MISEKSQMIIKIFLADWWADLNFQASNTVAGAALPIQSQEQLYNQLLGQNLRDIAAAAEGQLPDDMKEEIADAVQQFCEWMWARPGMPSSYDIPAQFWATPIGHMALKAHLWATGDELITMTEAAQICGKSISSLSQMIDRGKLAGYTDPDEPNPTRARRVIKRQVELLA